MAMSDGIGWALDEDGSIIEPPTSREGRSSAGEWKSENMAGGAFCPECRDPLFLRWGEVRAPHFAHFSDSQCEGPDEATPADYITHSEIQDALIEALRCSGFEAVKEWAFDGGRHDVYIPFLDAAIEVQLSPMPSSGARSLDERGRRYLEEGPAETLVWVFGPGVEESVREEISHFRVELSEGFPLAAPRQEPKGIGSTRFVYDPAFGIKPDLTSPSPLRRDARAIENCSLRHYPESEKMVSKINRQAAEIDKLRSLVSDYAEADMKSLRGRLCLADVHPELDASRDDNASALFFGYVSEYEIAELYGHDRGRVWRSAERPTPPNLSR